MRNVKIDTMLVFCFCIYLYLCLEDILLALYEALALQHHHCASDVDDSYELESADVSCYNILTPSLIPSSRLVLQVA